MNMRIGPDHLATCFVYLAQHFELIRLTLEYRHTRTHHENGSAPALTLLDLLHKAPALSEMLTPDAQKALSATSRSFHRLEL